jgi:site-specific DNA-methyltransferase (adenine-specific)
MHADKDSLVFFGDAGAVLRHLADEGIQVDCIVTSPPFYGQRDYGVQGQIGLEAHPQTYVDALVEVFEACRPVLRDTGSLWVNLGDTYWSGKGAHKSFEIKQGARRFGVRPQDLPGDGGWARPKQLLLLPHRFAIAMQDAGWLVRNDNVWVKPNPIPDQVRDRCEYLPQSPAGRGAMAASAGSLQQAVDDVVAYVAGRGFNFEPWQVAGYKAAVQALISK